MTPIIQASVDDKLQLLCNYIFRMFFLNARESVQSKMLSKIVKVKYGVQEYCIVILHEENIF